MSKLTNEIQECIDEAHSRLDSIEDETIVTIVADGVLSAHELCVSARIMAEKLKDGPPLKGALAQLAMLDQRVKEALCKEIV